MFLANLVNTIMNAGGFTLFALIFWLLPGISLLPKNIKLAKLDRLFLATTFGLASYVAVIFLIRLLGLPFWMGLMPFLFLAFKGVKSIYSKSYYKRLKVTKAQKLFAALALVGMMLQMLALFRSGIRSPDGIEFSGFSLHDSIWHVYLINELKENFPPRHGGFAPVTIKNYHFLLDLTTASVAKYLPLSTFELYYRIIPVFVSLLASLGVFVFARKIFGSEKTANVALFLALFAGNASWIVQFFRGDEFRYSSITFMLDPLIDMLLNPHAVIVMPIMIAGLLGLILIEKKKNLKLSILSSVAFGVMIGFKAWGGTLMLLALPPAAAWMSLREKRHDLWFVWLMALAVSLVVFLPIYDHESAAGLIFIPGWLLKRMVEDPDRYNMPKYYLLEQHYREKGNILRLIQINLTEVLIYIFGNLWIRTFGILTALKLIFKKLKASDVFILFVIVASLSFPLLFNQGRMAYDIIQYGPYGLLLLAVLAAPALVKMTSVFPKRWSLVALLILLAMSVPSNSRSVIDRARGKSTLITNTELEGYHYLRDQTDSESRVMVYPSAMNVSTALVAALTQRPTNFSAETFARITGEDFETRKQELLAFFNTIDPGQRQRIIETTSIDYILLTQEENASFNQTGIGLSKAFSNEAIIIYKVN